MNNSILKLDFKVNMNFVRTLCVGSTMYGAQIALITIVGYELFRLLCNQGAHEAYNSYIF